jgi:hypothetical protein
VADYPKNLAHFEWIDVSEWGCSPVIVNYLLCLAGQAIPSENPFLEVSHDTIHLVNVALDAVAPQLLKVLLDVFIKVWLIEFVSLLLKIIFHWWGPNVIILFNFDDIKHLAVLSYWGDKVSLGTARVTLKDNYVRLSQGIEGFQVYFHVHL